MPKLKVPPDKEREEAMEKRKKHFRYDAVSKAVDSLYKDHKKDINIPVEERISNSLLPSNIDPGISADNLKKELLGKLKVKSESSSTLVKGQSQSGFKEFETKKMAKVNVQDSERSNIKSHTSFAKVHSQNSFEDIETKRMTQTEVEDIKQSEVDLPPRPPEVEVIEPEKINIVKEIKKLLNQSSKMAKPVFKFEVSQFAAYHNYAKLLEANFNLESLLNTKERSVTSYGSEFNNTTELDNLLGGHPRWSQLRRRIERGSDWELEEISEEVRRKDLEAAIERGNHKSTVIHKEFLAEALEKEVKKGWMLILPLEKAKHIPNLIMSPMGVVEQLGINEAGEFVTKRRITHDLSFPGKFSKSSINSRVKLDTLEPCMFGHTMLRIIHKIVQLRAIHPKKKIWLRKDDTKSAYRRMHLNERIVFKTGVQIQTKDAKYLLLSLRLPFGGSPCPSEFCLLSDVITDVINDLLVSDEWIPKNLHSHYLRKIPKPKALGESVPFATAKEMSVRIDEGDICKADVFIDDIITVGVDVKDHLLRIMAAPSTVMHAFTHEAKGNTHIARQDFIVDDKNEAEGGPEEVKIVLGWKVNTRSLRVQLPFHKFKAWTEQINSIRKRKTVNAKELQSALGRMENIAIMIPMFGHFLNNIRTLEIKANLTEKNQVITKRVRDDLILATKFIKRAHEGVNMNTLTFRTPTKVYINDASEHGLGGFADHGRSWSYVLPEKLRGRAHINLLEFLAQLVSVWIDRIEKRLDPLDCILAMGDSTACMGWLRRSNFRENEEHDTEWLAKQKVARKLAEIILESETCLYRQWFKGEENVLADSLSRDGYFLTNDTHQSFLKSSIPSHVPPNFNISPIPNEICCFISSTLLLLPVKKQRLLQPRPSDLARSNAGVVSLLESTSTASSSMDSPDFSKTSSCPLSPRHCERPPSLAQIKENWWRERSVPPSHMWHRPSEQTTGQTQDWTSMAKLALSCKSNLEDIATKMVDDENRKLFL